MGFAIRIGDKYIKRTSQFGMFHGSMVLTDDPKEKRVWSRQADAEDKVVAVIFRKNSYPRDKKKLDKAGVLNELPVVIPE